MSIQTRAKVRFRSGGDECIAFHYRGTNGACVVMGSGGGITKEPGTDLFAARFNRAGFSVLAFDYRHFGESGGTPRQVIRIRRQLADWRAAIAHAVTLPEVDPTKVAVWGFSTAGGHVLKVASEADQPVAAVIAQTPYVDGFVSAPRALRHETLGVLLRFPFIAATDALRGVLGREPLLVPLSGPRGTVAMLTTPDSEDGRQALNPGDAYPDWVQGVAARSVLTLGTYRPGTKAAKIRCPVLVIAALEDQCVYPEPAIKAAKEAPHGELLELSGSHYAPFLAEHETTVRAEIAFLDRHLAGSTEHA